MAAQVTDVVHQVERVKVGDDYVDVRRSYLGDDKPTILMLHGIGVSGAYLLPFAELLARTYNVHVIDLPGYGKTPKPDHALSPLELAAVTAAYLEQSRISDSIIVGQSMGCQTAVRLAQHYPDRCDRLILIGPTVNKMERRWYMQLVRLFQDTFHEPLRVNRIIFRDYLRMGSVRFLKTVRLMLNDKIEDGLRVMDIPVRIVRGEDDRIVPREWTAYLRATNKEKVSLREVKGGPHNIQYTNPEELLAECIDFLKG